VQGSTGPGGQFYSARIFLLGIFDLFAFFQRAAAALRALSLRWLFVIAFDRAMPPAFPAFRAISLRCSGVSEAARPFASATACGFFPFVFGIFKSVPSLPRH
jgi:hypothetical protein